MIFQAGRYCDIRVKKRQVEDTYWVVIRRSENLSDGIKEDYYLGFQAVDLSHALVLWTAIEKAPVFYLKDNWRPEPCAEDDEAWRIRFEKLGDALIAAGVKGVDKWEAKASKLLAISEAENILDGGAE